MSEERSRRLAAVMFTDVVGYTALMQDDEEAARVVRLRHREALEAAITAHGGELVQYLGDGSLSTFPSTVRAVSAAVEVQQALRDEVPLRIGVHQGEIAFDEQGIYGDSVNVAARVMGMGTAGSVLVSDRAQDELRNQRDFSTASLGHFDLKNVKYPMVVHAVRQEGQDVPTREDVLPGTFSAERVRQLIREIHRRSLWQVLGIYAVASWAVLSVVDTLGGALNLPDWFPAFALALLIIGLPIVLATAFVQEGIGGADGGATADPTGSAAEPSRSGAVTLFTWKNAFLGGVGAFAVVGGVATISLLLGGDPVGAGSADDGERPSIAVIPFENLSAEEANAPFARGLHDDLLTQLQKIASVDVLARTTMMQYEGTTKAASTIAAELGVTTILEGGVQRAGDQVRINVQLIDGSTDAHLWAETYTRAYTVENVFEVQSDIARNITASLRATLTPEEQSQIATVPTTNAEAYAAYLAGKAHFVRKLQIGDTRAAVGSFEEAVGLDASFGVGWAALAEARSHLASLLLGAEAAAFQRSAQEALDEAVRLAPDAAETQMAQGLLAYQAERDYETAEQHFAAVLSQQPGDVYALYWLGVLEKRQGRFEQARQYYQRAAYLDPMDPNYWGELAFANRFLGLYDETARNLRQAIVLVPEDWVAYEWLFRLRLLQADTVGARADLEEFGDRPGTRSRRLTLDYYLRRDLEALADSLTGDEAGWFASPDLARVRTALLYWEAGRTDQAVQLAESLRDEFAAGLEALGDLALPRQRFNALVLLAIVDAILGNDGAARQEIEESLALSRATDPLGHRDVTELAAWVYLILGDHDAAISTIETRLDMADGDMTPAFLDIWPLYDPIRDDPRFQALLQR